MKARLYKTGVGAIVIILSFFVFLPLNAQSPQGTGVTLRVEPQNVRANSTAAVYLESFEFDLRGATVRWFINGTEEPHLQNEKVISGPTGDSGSQMSVQAEVNIPGVGVRTARTVLRPAGVDLVIEPQTSVPDFYRGRALPSQSAALRAVAVPDIQSNGIRINPSNLVFTWLLNGSVLFGGPHIGRDVVTIAMPFAGDAQIEVRVETRDGRERTSAMAVARSVLPIVRFYEENPLTGASLIARERFTVQGDEIAVRVEPYYVAPNSFASGASNITWSIDGTAVSNASADPQSFVIRNTRGAGAGLVGFRMQNLRSLGQEAAGFFTVLFSDSGSVGQ